MLYHVPLYTPNSNRNTRGGRPHILGTSLARINTDLSVLVLALRVLALYLTLGSKLALNRQLQLTITLHGLIGSHVLPLHMAVAC